MAKNVKVKTKFNMSGLSKFTKAVKEKYIIKVGIIGNQAAEEHEASGMSNASLGLIHEFGSKNKNIPQRSFLRMPIESKNDTIVKDVAKNGEKITKELSKGNSLYLYERIALACEAVIQEAFATGGFGQWEGLKSRTIKKKGSSSPLIDTGELRRSVSSKVIKK